MWLTGRGLTPLYRFGDVAWEEHVLPSYHRLARIPRYVGVDDDELKSD